MGILFVKSRIPNRVRKIHSRYLEGSCINTCHALVLVRPGNDWQHETGHYQNT
jgi:hypothetical protein